MGTFNKDFLSFNEEEHRYTDSSGNIYESVSAAFDRVKKPFDAEGISWGVAKKQLREQGIDSPTEEALEAARELVLEEWEKKKNDSIEFGNYIHEAIEDWVIGGIPLPVELKKVFDKVDGLTEYAKKIEAEQVVYSEKYQVAGTIDMPIYRTNRGDSVIDIADHKTNLSKGITFDSKYRFLDPFSHLEACNYNEYAIKMSCYAWMLEEQFGRKIGNLKIFYIYRDDDEEFQIKVYPIPYMKMEAEALMMNSFRARNLAFNDEPEIGEAQWD